MECTITNAEGQKITVSDREAQGDMEILELSLPPERTEVMYDGCPMYSITVPYSESFTFEIEKIGYRGIFSASNCDVGLEGTNISNVILHSSDKASITGENMHLWLSTGYYDNWTCDVDIQKQKAVTVQRLDTGMLVEGLEGDAILRSRSVKEEVEYTFTGEAVEIDVVSQPGEILITPVEK